MSIILHDRIKIYEKIEKIKYKGIVCPAKFS